MIKFLRLIFRKTPFYSLAAKSYHIMRRLWMRTILTFSHTKYLAPRPSIGPYKSQFGQDFYLEKLGLLRNSGFFLEVGSNHPVYNSNSHYLESCLGWSGISIDGVDFSKEFENLRPKTIFLNCLIDTKNAEAEFYEVINVNGWETQISSMYESNLKLGKGFKAHKKIVETRRISDLKQIQQQIDLCLIDVEGHEFEVLNSIDWISNSPSVFVIENVGEFYPRSHLVRYMEEKGYKFIARIGVTDDIFVRNK